ncbi:hypothetical protein PMAYCL1PPCAC_20705, partial [Pristionchus mayeri]
EEEEEEEGKRKKPKGLCLFVITLQRMEDATINDCRSRLDAIKIDDDVDELTSKHNINYNKLHEKTGKGEEKCSFQDGAEAEKAVVESKKDLIGFAPIVNKDKVIIDIAKKVNDLSQRVTGLSTELVMERQKYLELEEKYSNDTSSIKQRVNTLATLLEREQQKTIKLEKNVVAEQKSRMNVTNKLEEQRQRFMETILDSKKRIDELTSKVAEFENTSLHAQQIRIEEFTSQIAHYDTLLMQTLQKELEQLELEQRNEKLTSNIAHYEKTSVHAQQRRIDEFTSQNALYASMFLQSLQISNVDGVSLKRKCTEDEMNDEEMEEDGKRKKAENSIDDRWVNDRWEDVDNFEMAEEEE